MVDEMKAKTGIEMALKAVGLPKSSYYYKNKEAQASCAKEYPLYFHLFAPA